MNVAAWTLLVVLSLLAWGVPWGVSKFKIRWFANDIRWVAGAFGVLAAVGAGGAALGTFIGRHLIPWFAGLHPAVPVAAGVGFVAAVAYAFLAALPDRLIDLPADGFAIGVAFLAPLLAGFAFGGIGATAVDGLAFLNDLSAQVTGWAR